MEARLRRLMKMRVKPVGPYVTNSLGMRFALIPPGTFMMGSPESEEGREDNETQHKVTLTKAFLIGIHPVTQAFWQTIMGDNPSRNKGDELPVESVSWENCQEFLQKLSESDGHEHRLPSEAEWEYGCRAGTTTLYFFGKTITAKQANFVGRGGRPGKTTVVGLYAPNAWGLYDMHGNVWELCADWDGEYPEGEAVDPTGSESGSVGVFRGGSFYNQASAARSSRRVTEPPGSRGSTAGLRLVREIS